MERATGYRPDRGRCAVVPPVSCRKQPLSRQLDTDPSAGDRGCLDQRGPTVLPGPESVRAGAPVRPDLRSPNGVARAGPAHRPRRCPPYATRLATSSERRALVVDFRRSVNHEVKPEVVLVHVGKDRMTARRFFAFRPPVLTEVQSSFEPVPTGVHAGIGRTVESRYLSAGQLVPSRRPVDGVAFGLLEGARVLTGTGSPCASIACVRASMSCTWQGSRLIDRHHALEVPA